MLTAFPFNPETLWKPTFEREQRVDTPNQIILSP